MSGPVEETSAGSELGMSTIEVREGRSANIGRLTVMRILPTKRRRTIGPWCFVDLMSPGDVEEPPALEIGPHPHIGLSTVTWLLEGTALHGDSLGTEQLIRPGQLNLMTAGNGIAHAEQGVDTDVNVSDHGVMGVQMWLAQPESTRHGQSRLQHLAELPEVEYENAQGKLLIGLSGGEESAAETDHPTVGLDLTVLPGAVVPTDPRFEYGVVPIDRPIKVDEEVVEPGSLAIVPVGRSELTFDTQGHAGRLMLLGGEPLGDRVMMWWNFVARDKDEITRAWRDWDEENEERFGPVPSDLERIEAPRPPWLKASK